MTNHPLEQEELMAYLDGELPASRAAAASDHLESCAECRDLAADLQSVSRRLMAWQVEPSGTPDMEEINAALDERATKPKKPRSALGGWRNWFRNPLTLRLMMSGSLAAVVVLMIWGARIAPRSPLRSDKSVMEGYVSPPGQQPVPPGGGIGQSADTYSSNNTYSRGRSSRPKRTEDKPASPESNSPGYPSASNFNDSIAPEGSRLSPPPPLPLPQEDSKDLGLFGYNTAGKLTPTDDARANVRAKAAAPAANKQEPVTRGPMIIHTAQLTLTTREFDKVRAEVDAILKLHHGYAGEMVVNTPSGSARSLNGTLRVPITELDAMLNDLKRMGRVEREFQTGEEVTQRYVDLEARLANARNTERRLTDILRERTGKLADVLAVEESISTTRGEIEEMEAQRKTMANQVDYATLQVTITEEYKAALEVVPVTTWTRISNAGVEGYHNLAEGLISLVLVFVSSGPSLVFWGVLLFFPVRMIWKKIRLRVATA
jgi:hypothetical protein